MVTKLCRSKNGTGNSSVLAKIHMVTKQRLWMLLKRICSVLAKIHMVTKPRPTCALVTPCSVLAKIHMVTKPIVSALV